MVASGTRLGRYQLGNVLGSGGMGVVFEAVDAQLGREVAIKVFQAGCVKPRRALSMLRSEARALARRSDPRIVEVFDFGVLAPRAETGLPPGCVETNAYMVMDVRGRPLSKVAFASWDELSPIAFDVIHALARVHATGATHGDVKPPNIVLGQRGVPKILDFGLARLASRRTDGARVGMGTPSYMAPELFTEGASSAASDHYAFCVSLYELVYGRRPFEAGSLQELVDAKIGGEVDWTRPVLRIPRSVRAAIARGLNPDPTKRFTSVHALAEALRGPARPRRGALLAGVVGFALTCTGVAAARTPAAAPTPGSVTAPVRSAVYEGVARSSGAASCRVDIEHVESTYHLADAEGLTRASAALAAEAGRLAFECSDDRHRRLHWVRQAQALLQRGESRPALAYAIDLLSLQLDEAPMAQQVELIEGRLAVLKGIAGKEVLWARYWRGEDVIRRALVEDEVAAWGRDGRLAMRMYALGKNLLHQGRLYEAYNLLAVALAEFAIDGRALDAANTMYDMALVLMRQGRPDLAALCLEQLLALNGRDSHLANDVLLYLAQAYVELRQPARARRHLEEVDPAAHAGMRTRVEAGRAAAAGRRSHAARTQTPVLHSAIGARARQRAAEEVGADTPAL